MKIDENTQIVVYYEGLDKAKKEWNKKTLFRFTENA